MATEQEYQAFLDRVAALEETVADRLSSRLVSDPQLADVLVKQIDDLLSKGRGRGHGQIPPPPDKGPRATGRRRARKPPTPWARPGSRQAITPYDETVSSERLVAMGDLYYIYQHEQIGVFRAVQQAAGTVPVRAPSTCPAAPAAYRAVPVRPA